MNTRFFVLLAVALFVASTLLRFLLADFDKAIRCYTDELMYLQAARGLQATGQITLYAFSMNFQKVFYSILLSPFFRMGSTQAAIRAIALFNSILVSSSVFPAMLLARRITNSRWATTAVMLLTLTLPDMAFSMTFMSENFSIPLTLWLMWGMLCVLEAKPLPAVAGAVALGIGAQLLFLTKQLGLALVLAFALLLCFELVVAVRPRKATALQLFAFLAAYWLAGKLAGFLLFREMAVGYINASTLSFDLYSLFYLFWSLLTGFVFLLLAFFYLPVVLPLLGLHLVGLRQKRLVLLALLALVLSVCATSFWISFREDLGYAIPRQHIRYYTPYFVPLLAAALSLLARKPDTIYIKGKAGEKLMMGWTVFACTAACFVLHSFPVHTVDAPMLKYFTNLVTNGLVLPHITAGNEALVVETGLLVFLPLLVAAIAAATWMVHRGYWKVLAAGLVAVILTVNLVNTVLFSRQLRHEYGLYADGATQAETLDNALQALEGTILLVYDYFEWSEANRTMDTYITVDAIRFTDSVMDSLAASGQPTDVGGLNLPSLHYKPYPIQLPQSVDAIDYIVAPDHLIPALHEDFYEDITPEGITNYRLYKSLQPEVLVFQ